MVVLNTQVTQVSRFGTLELKHIVDVPRSGCSIATAREVTTGRTRVFLIVNHEGKIYVRHGINGTWVEIADPVEYRYIRQLVSEAVKTNRIPYYTTRRG